MILGVFWTRKVKQPYPEPDPAPDPDPEDEGGVPERGPSAAARVPDEPELGVALLRRRRRGRRVDGVLVEGDVK